MPKLKFNVKFNLVNLLRLFIVLFLIMLMPFFIFAIQASVLKNSVIQSKVALILGAGIRSDGEPSWVLKSRLETGLELYKSGKVNVLLVSGDNRFNYYNEPRVMKKYLIDAGVPESDIVEDFAGRRTLDSCWRAKNVFKASSVTIVTQAFHIPRSVFLCKNVGLQTDYAIAPNGYLSTTVNGIIREVPSSFLAVFETLVDKTAQVKGEGSERDLSQINN